MFKGKKFIILKIPFSAEKWNMQQPLDKIKLNTDLQLTYGHWMAVNRLLFHYNWVTFPSMIAKVAVAMGTERKLTIWNYLWGLFWQSLAA